MFRNNKKKKKKYKRTPGNSVLLEKDKVKDMARTKLKELIAKKIDELAWLYNKLTFRIIKNIFLGKGDIGREIEFKKIRKMTEKNEIKQKN